MSFRVAYIYGDPKYWMHGNFDTTLAFILSQEGGWADDPRHDGGPTMHGITLPTYRASKDDQTLPADDLRTISAEECQVDLESGVG